MSRLTINTGKFWPKTFYSFPPTPLNCRQFKLFKMPILGGLHIKPIAALNSSIMIRLLEVSLMISWLLRGGA